MGGRRLPAEKGELLRLDEDDDDGRDDIAGGSRLSPQALHPRDRSATRVRTRRWGAARQGRGDGARERSRGRYPKVRGLSHGLLLHSKREERPLRREFLKRDTSTHRGGPRTRIIRCPPSDHALFGCKELSSELAFWN